MRQKLSLAAEPTQQRILVLAMEINPFEEMLTISGAACSIVVAVLPTTRDRNEPIVYLNG